MIDSCPGVELGSWITDITQGPSDSNPIKIIEQNESTVIYGEKIIKLNI